MYEVFVTTRAEKEIEALPIHIQVLIWEAILELTNFPNVPNIKKLQGFTSTYRRRVGDYRIIFEVQEEEKKVILVIKVAHRKEVY